jgi:hypothetical protein
MKEISYEKPNQSSKIQCATVNGHRETTSPDGRAPEYSVVVSRGHFAV